MLLPRPLPLLASGGMVTRSVLQSSIVTRLPTGLHRHATRNWMLSCGSQYLGSGICRWKHSDGLIGFFFIVGVGL